MFGEKFDISFADSSLNTIELTKASKHRNESGMHWLITACFVVGELAGAGIVAMPTAMAQTGNYVT